MKKLVGTTLVALFAGVSAPALAADAMVMEPTMDVVDMVPTRNFYISLFGGLSIAHKPDVGADAGSELFSEGFEADLDPGFIVGGTAGYRFSRFRGEAELSYQRFDVQSLGALVTPIAFLTDGHLSATYILGNIWIDAFRLQDFGIYAGGGIGGASIDADVDRRGNLGGGDDGIVDGNEFVLAGQLGAGATYDVSERVALDLGYRFKITDDYEIDSVQTEEEAKIDGLLSHTIQLGVAVKF